MSQISLSTCPICHAQNTLSLEKVEFKGRSHQWYECAECGSALLWLGDDRWAYQKVGREDKAHLLKTPLSEQDLLALLPEQEEIAPAPQAGEASAEPEEDALASLLSRDWPEYDEDPFAFLFRSAPEEGRPATAQPLEEEPAQEGSEPMPSWSEEMAGPAEPAIAETEEDWQDQELEPFASMFEAEWEEEAVEAAPAPFAEGEVPSEEGEESPALFSRAWFAEMETAESSAATVEDTSEPEDVVSAEQEETPTLVAAEEPADVYEETLRPLAFGDFSDEFDSAPSVTVSRDLPEQPRERSALGRVIPWLLALCLIAFLFLVAVAVYQMMTGSPLF